MRTMFTRAALVACAALATLATTAVAGPPWIAVEIPSNPHHPSTRGATFLVRAYHHSSALDVPMRGTAEGLVDGKRRSLPLSIQKTNTPGVFAVRADLPEQGTWIVAVTIADGEATATALVTLSRSGEVRDVQVPSNRSRDGWTVPRAVTAEDIETQLRTAAKVAALENQTATRNASLGAGLLALIFAAALHRRRSV